MTDAFKVHEILLLDKEFEVLFIVKYITDLILRADIQNIGHKGNWKVELFLLVLGNFKKSV